VNATNAENTVWIVNVTVMVYDIVPTIF